MKAVPDIPPVANGQVVSNQSIPSLYEQESSNSSLESLTQPHPIQKMNAGEVSSIQASEVEDVSITGMSTDILEIVFDYALNKFDDCKDRLEAGRPKFIAVLNNFVKARTRIDMALPAFPFKSANKAYKALGFLPDKAEEIALARLHNMCKRIEEIYEPGSSVVIISDGLVYNGVFHDFNPQSERPYRPSLLFC
jgi:hypothetical protein